ncbi:MAG: amidohydrolase family protein [Acidimicrobiia bacterium]
MNQMVLANCRFVEDLCSVAAGDTGLWIRDGLIAASGNADDLIADARAEGTVDVVDLDGAYLLPGLINMHTHFGVIHPDTTDDARLQGETAAGMALRMAECARATLEAGITTVRLVSEKRGFDTALRSAITRGETPGPRIFTAGQAITATGGHGLGSHGVEADGPDEWRLQARTQIKDGSDLVKVMISGGISDENEGLNRLQLEEDELRAAIEIAHAWGRPVAGHVGGADLIDLAIDSGIDTVEHGYALTEAVAQRMAANRIWLVPTMMVTRGDEYFRRIKAPGWLIDRLGAFAPRHAESVALAAGSGVRILAGTDFVPSERFDDTSAMIRELELLVDAGMAPIEALRAATTLAAECLGTTGRLGCLAPDAAADVLAVHDDPRIDISTLRRFRLIVARGRIVLDRRSSMERVGR